MGNEKTICFAIEQLKLLLAETEIKDVRVSIDTYSDGTKSFDVSITYGDDERVTETVFASGKEYLLNANGELVEVD